MSRASKIFLGGSLVATTVTVWGVHFLQRRESDTMYQGVLRDEARLREKALSLIQHPISTISSSLPSLPLPSHPPSTPHAGSSGTPLNTPSSPVNNPTPFIPPSPSSSSSSTSAPDHQHHLQNPSIESQLLRRIEQPEKVIDPDCETCKISPTPQLLESQSREVRAREREERRIEYEAQKHLGVRLGREQGGRV